MDNQRIILFFTLSFVLLLLWQAWQDDFTQTAEPQIVAERLSPPSDSSVNSSAKISTSNDIPVVPKLAANVTTTLAPAGDSGLHGEKRLHIRTDVLDIEIDTAGGDIRQVDLIAYPKEVNRPDDALRLMQDSGFKVFIAQTGLLSDLPAPDHHAVFSAEKSEYVLKDGVDELRVPLQWRGKDGISVTKTFIFHRDSYLIEIEQQVNNGSAQEWKGYQYRQFQRTRPGDDESSAFIYTYTGAVFHNNEDKYEKYDFDDMDDEDLNRDFASGWAAMIQHYFVAAWLPEASEQNHYYSKAPENSPYVLGLVSPEQTVSAGQAGRFTSRLYVGPKDQKRLESLSEGLKLTVDYGILTVVAQPLFWLLAHIHTLVGNWGWSIIILTLIIKLIFYKLSEKQYKSMANMRVLQPKVTSIRERYGDDRQRMSKAMMELYKKEKVNPLGGCLPMLVQIPVFIALYWTLLESVEVRQADFIFWIQDLSSKDPFYILPLLMGISMFIQQKLNPPPPDPVQAKVLMALPFVFTLFFAFFPSGLVLYWVTNSVLSILQQWYITRRIEQQNAAKKISS